MFLSQNRTQTMRGKKLKYARKFPESPGDALKPQVEDDYSLLGHRYHLLNGAGHLAHAVLAATSREYLY